MLYSTEERAIEYIQKGFSYNEEVNERIFPPFSVFFNLAWEEIIESFKRRAEF